MRALMSFSTSNSTKSAGNQFKPSVKLSCPVVKRSITIVNVLTLSDLDNVTLTHVSYGLNKGYPPFHSLSPMRLV